MRSVVGMPSLALEEWQGTRSVQLDELDAAHGAVGGTGPGRRYATGQLNHAYAVVLAAQFQGFCRDLHTESADMVAGAIGSLSSAGSVNSSTIARLVLIALTQSRQLDRGNATPGSIGADFKGFDLDIWDAARQLHVRTQSRLRKLEQLNVWRNAVAHQDFDFEPHELEVLGGMRTIDLRRVRAFRSCCDRLAVTFDEVLARHLEPVVGGRPW
jgi:hypothetical protein